MKFVFSILWVSCLWLACSTAIRASDLMLMERGSTNYQILIPDKADSQEVQEDLRQVARLLQVAFQAQGVEIPLRVESERLLERPAIWLGNTEFAKSKGFDPARLQGWSYAYRAFDREIIIAGHDHAPKAKVNSSKRPNWNRLGTAKAAVDFAREYLGVRFLYPDLPSYQPLRKASEVDWLESPSLEFLPMAAFRVPHDLNLPRAPLLKLNTAHPTGSSLYDLSHHRFPRVDMEFGNHSWSRAIPAKHYEEHPEYFALVNGERLKPSARENAQYCISNPKVQELIYQDVADHFNRGFDSADLGQPDGFRSCECEDCEKLYGTGKDWSEKIWVFHRKVAEKLETSHPNKEVSIMSYILTAQPPKSFNAFPSNTSIMLTGTNEEDIAAWNGIQVPQGFSGYVYNWCANLGTRYTPMRTPSFVERQVKRLADAKMNALLRDGPGQLFGLEGPVYYTMGRMFDNPKGLDARSLVNEFCEGAFPQTNVQFHMKAFYDELYHAISIYSDHLGTRAPGWQYPLYSNDARPKKSVTNPIQLIAFLYAPHVLANLEAHLKQAETLANQNKIQERLRLVRSEFDYIKHLAGVAHLYQAWQISPEGDALPRLLDAIDRRNEFLGSLFQKEQKTTWSRAFFPFPGHSLEHLKLAYDGYQEPFAKTCYNWDTASMRKISLTGSKLLKVPHVQEKSITMSSPFWDEVPAHALSANPPQQDLPRDSKIQLLWSDHALWIRFISEFGDKAPMQAWTRDQLPLVHESVEVQLAPSSTTAEQFRLVQGPTISSVYDAVRGRVADAMDPRFGNDDATWNGAWTREMIVDKKKKRWTCLISVPFETLNTPVPTPGIRWKGNFARGLGLPKQQMDRQTWIPHSTFTDPSGSTGMGEIEFSKD